MGSPTRVEAKRAVVVAAAVVAMGAEPMAVDAAWERLAAVVELEVVAMGAVATVAAALVARLNLVGAEATAVRADFACAACVHVGGRSHPSSTCPTHPSSRHRPSSTWPGPCQWRKSPIRGCA